MNVPTRPEELSWSESRHGDTTRFRLRPHRLVVAVLLLCFAVLWNGFLAFWYVAVAAGGSGPGAIALWFPLLHVAAGLGAIYLGLAMLFSRIEIEIDRGNFTIRRRPLPLPGSMRRPIASIIEFQPMETSLSSPRQRHESDVQLLSAGGRSRRLRLALGDHQQAIFVASRLGSALQAVKEPRTYRG